MSRPFDHHLDVELPGFFREFAQGLQLCELRLVAGIGDAAGAQAVAQRIRHIVLLHDPGNVVEPLVEEVLLMVVGHPLGHDGAAATHNAGDALGNQRQVLHQHAGMDGHVVHALLGLLFDDFQHQVGAEVFNAFHARYCFVDWHSADGHRRLTEYGFTNLADAATGGEVHYGVRAKMNGGVQFAQLFVHIGGDGRIPDVGVDLAQRGHANAHGLQFGMVDVGGNDHPSHRHFIANGFRGKLFTLGNVQHLFCNQSFAGIMHLRKIVVSRRGLLPPPVDPFFPHLRSRAISIGITITCRHPLSP